MKRFKLVIPDKIDKKYARRSIELSHADGEEISLKNDIPTDWLIEIEEKSEAEDWVIHNTWKYWGVRGLTIGTKFGIDAHEAGHELGAKNERERFDELMALTGEYINYCDSFPSTFRDRFKSAYEKLKNNQ